MSCTRCSLKPPHQLKIKSFALARASDWKIGIVGAASELGRRIVDPLIGVEGCRIVATSRDLDRLNFLNDDEGVECRALDLEEPVSAANALRDCEVVVFCPILSLCVDTAIQLRELGSDARFILFSSNNVGLDGDAPVYEALRAAEERVEQISQPWAMIRPTMIYGAPDDGNLGRLMRLARRFPMLPLIGSGKALQQPIHYEDLAGLVLDLIFDMDWRLLEIGAAGPEICTLEELYNSVVRASDKNAKIVKLPTGVLSLVFRMMERIGLKPPLSSAQLARVETDKLPTWPLREDWSGDVSLQDGLGDIRFQIREHEETTKVEKT